jgi:LmbE family N-acetylglucosaminyl deacetylase
VSLIHNKIFVFFAHPDDAEFGAGATVGKLARQGHQVWYVICTGGSGGIHTTETTPDALMDIREREQQGAMDVLGVKGVIPLRYQRRPGEWGSPSELVEKMMRVIRQHRPEIIITHDPWRTYNVHPAHRMVGWAATEAGYLADSPWYYPQHFAEGLRPCKPEEIWLFGSLEPNYWVDVKDTLHLKVEALRQHRTQLGSRVDPPGLEEFTRRMQGWAAESGKAAGLEYAESFHRIGNHQGI